MLLEYKERDNIELMQCLRCCLFLASPLLHCSRKMLALQVPLCSREISIRFLRTQRKRSHLSEMSVDNFSVRISTPIPINVHSYSSTVRSLKSECFITSNSISVL